MKFKLPSAIIIASILLSACGNSSYSEVSTSQTEPSVQTESETSSDYVPTEFEVVINAKAQKDGTGVKFNIETNLPDETVLMVSLRRGDYNTDDNFTAQDKVTISGGKGQSGSFSNKGAALSGNYDLTISMSLPSTQSDHVRQIIGQNGEYMTGSIVEDSSIGNSRIVSALFTFSADDNSITPVSEYENTVFREETSTAAASTTRTTLSGTDTERSKVKNKVQQYIDDNYTYTSIDSVTVTEDLGTDDAGDYIASVSLTWDQKNSGKTSQEMLKLYSSDMAARMYDDLPEIQELVVYWTVPYLNNGSAKISFERTDNGMKYTDKIFDSNFN